MPALPSLERLREDKRTHRPSDGRGPAPDASPGQRRGPQALAVLPTSSNSNLLKRFFWKGPGWVEQRWREIKTWHFPPSLSPNLLEATSPPLGGKKKSHQREGGASYRTLESAPGPPAPPPPLGAQDGWALRTHPARLAQPGPAAAGWLRPQPGAFQTRAERIFVSIN